MAKIINSFILTSDFDFRYCPKNKKVIIYVSEYKRTYHVTVRRLGFSCPVFTDFILYKKYIKSPDDYACSCDYIISSVRHFLFVNRFLRPNV